MRAFVLTSRLASAAVFGDHPHRSHTEIVNDFPRVSGLSHDKVLLDRHQHAHEHVQHSEVQMPNVLTVHSPTLSKMTRSSSQSAISHGSSQSAVEASVPSTNTLQNSRVSPEAQRLTKMYMQSFGEVPNPEYQKEEFDGDQKYHAQHKQANAHGLIPIGSVVVGSDGDSMFKSGKSDADRYVVRSLLGHGFWGEVYEVHRCASGAAEFSLRRSHNHGRNHHHHHGDAGHKHHHSSHGSPQEVESHAKHHLQSAPIITKKEIEKQLVKDTHGSSCKPENQTLALKIPVANAVNLLTKGAAAKVEVAMHHRLKKYQATDAAFAQNVGNNTIDYVLPMLHSFHYGSGLSKMPVMVEIQFSNPMSIRCSIYKVSHQNVMSHVKMISHQVFPKATPIAKYQFSFPQLKCMAHDLLHALLGLHSAGIAHRDLKRDNIYLYHNRYALGDLGFAIKSGKSVSSAVGQR